ncbi:unnamed protein product, partial [Prorocentrum cordatum]
MKQLLNVSQQGRDLAGVVLDALILPATCMLMTMMPEQTVLYAEAVKKAGKDHQLGPPFIWAMGGLLKALVSLGDSIGAQNAQIAQKAYSEYGEYSVDTKCELVPFCRQDKVYQKEQRRLTISCRDPFFRTMLIGSIMHIPGVKRKHGRAPAAHMGGEIQQFCFRNASEVIEDTEVRADHPQAFG